MRYIFQGKRKSTMSDSKNIPILELTEKNLKANILSMSDKVKQKIYP